MKIQKTVFIEVHPLALEALVERLSHAHLKSNFLKNAIAQVVIQLVEWLITRTDIICHKQIQ